MESSPLHFKEWDAPTGVKASALFDAGLTSGIYVLVFVNGEEYVGKTVNFPRRFMDHRRRWSDIVSVRFAPVIAEDLDRMERAVVSAREADGVLLRNLLLLSQPLGSSRLDVLIDKQAQAEWLTADEDYTGLHVDPQRIALARRRLRSRNKLDQLMCHPQGDAVVATVAAYISAVIPSPDVGGGNVLDLDGHASHLEGPTESTVGHPQHPQRGSAVPGGVEG